MTDYLQTNTFKDIEWSNTAGNYKHDLTLKMSGTGGPGENGEYLLRINNYRNAGDVGPSVLVSPTFGFDASDGDRDSRLTPGHLLINDTGDHEKTYVSAGSITLTGNIGSSAETSVLFSPYNISVNGKVISYSALEKLNDLPNIPTKTSELENDSGFITSSALTNYATKSWVGQQGYLTSVAWGDIAGKPTFATVATSGSYNDLTNKPTNLVTTNTVQKITGKKSFSNETWFTEVKVRNGDPVNTLGLYPDLLSIVELNHNVAFYTTHFIIDQNYDNQVTINYRDIATETWVGQQGYQTASEVSAAASTAASAAVSNQTKETWTFTLADGSTVTKSVVLG